MKFISLINYKKLYEGGNAIQDAERISYTEGQQLLDYIKEEILPALNITENDISTIGSFGKKEETETYGDLDIVVLKESILKNNNLETEEDVLLFINSILSDLGFENKIYRGMVQVSAGIPIPGSNKIAQVDFMLSESLEWSKFIYHSPNFKENESKYKGVYRNALLFAIITELNKEVVKYFDDETPEEIEQDIVRMPHGIYRSRKTWRGKRGKVKTPKTLKEFYKFITIDPQEVVNIVVGPDYTINDISSFEKLWNIVTSDDYIHKDKFNEILEKFLLNLQSMKLDIPEEVKTFI